MTIKFHSSLLSTFFVIIAFEMQTDKKTKKSLVPTGKVQILGSLETGSFVSERFLGSLLKRLYSDCI